MSAKVSRVPLVSHRRAGAPKRKSASALFVIGFGRLGSALAAQAQAAGISLVGIETRDPARQRAARRLLGRASRPLATADLIALAVPDGAVTAMAVAVAARLARRRPAPVVFHLAGSLGLEGLAPVQAAGGLVGSLHPFCAVASAASPLSGAACALAGAPGARARLATFANTLGLRPFARPPSARVRYHLAAVLTVASAGVAAAVGDRLLESTGATAAEARTALAALLRSVAFNLERADPANALTGPFVRGDLERIRLQREALADDPQGLALYRAVGAASAHFSPLLSEPQRAAVLAALG